ncbi:MAG TPA: DUF4249 family protein [Ignavibacteriales bacterium]|nr:DUF4249 family protein [Ignavibacteriales bacterium]
MNRKIYITIIIFFSVFFIGCGEGIVDINDISYEPKIVVEAMIYPGQKVNNVKISQNFPLTNSYVDKLNIYISNAEVYIYSGQQKYQLTYDPVTKSYYYAGNDFVIDFNKTYRLEVKATIDGKNLFCSAETYTPAENLIVDVNKTIKNDDTIRYRSNKLPIVTFKPISNINFYPIANTFVEKADSLSFISENIFGLEYKDIKDKIVDYKERYTWLQNIKDVSFFISKSLDWFDFIFYGKYKLTLYAANQDYQSYLLTASRTQEIDGNFHEPRFNILGDGIGYFASAVKFEVEYYLLPAK